LREELPGARDAEELRGGAGVGTETWDALQVGGRAGGTYLLVGERQRGRGEGCFCEVPPDLGWGGEMSF